MQLVLFRCYRIHLFLVLYNSFKFFHCKIFIGFHATWWHCMILASGLLYLEIKNLLYSFCLRQFFFCKDFSCLQYLNVCVWKLISNNHFCHPSHDHLHHFTSRDSNTSKLVLLLYYNLNFCSFWGYTMIHTYVIWHRFSIRLSLRSLQVK